MGSLKPKGLFGVNLDWNKDVGFVGEMDIRSDGHSPRQPGAEVQCRRMKARGW